MRWGKAPLPVFPVFILQKKNTDCFDVKVTVITYGLLSEFNLTEINFAPKL